MRLHQRLGFQLASLLLLVALWFLASLMGGDVVPTPLDTLPEFTSLVVDGTFIEPLLNSLGRALLGLALSLTVGILYGVAAARSLLFDRCTVGLLSVLLFFPTLVVIFANIVIFGPTMAAVAAILVIAVSPTVAVAVRDALREIDQDALSMADSYQASKVSRFVDVYLPFLAPSILGVSRIGFAMCWKVVMLTEVFGMTGGLGYQIRSTYASFDLARLLGWLGVFIVTLLLMERLIRLLERRFIAWQT